MTPAPAGPPAPGEPEERAEGAPVPLPAVYEATLDPETLEALFADIEGLCLLEELRLRPLPGAPFARGPADLGEAREALVRGECSSLQLRYTHDGESWLDTITPTPVGYRLVRIGDPLQPE